MTNVVAGAYVISAKTIIDPGSAGDPVVTVCTLTAGSVSDVAEVAFPNDHSATVNLEVTQTFAATGSIVLRCNSTAATNARRSKIVAIKVDTVTREAVAG